MVTITTVWADERLYYPVDALRYTAAKHFAKGKSDPGFWTKLAIARTWRSGHGRRGSPSARWPADSAYGDQDGFRAGLAEGGLPFVMALEPRRGV